MANVLDRYTNDELMAMKKPELIKVASEIGKLKEFLALCDEKVQRKRHSKRVLKPSKNPKLNGKLTWQADTSEKPVVVEEDAGFFEIKAKFIHEICGLPYAEKEPKEPTLRDMILAAIAEEEAKAANDTENLEAQMDEVFGKKK